MRRLIIVSAGGAYTTRKKLFRTLEAAKTFADNTLGKDHRRIGIATEVKTSWRGRGRDFLWRRGTVAGSRHASFEWVDAPKRAPWARYRSLILVTTIGDGRYDLALFTSLRAALGCAHASLADQPFHIIPIRGRYDQGVSLEGKHGVAYVEPIGAPDDSPQPWPWTRWMVRARRAYGWRRGAGAA